MKQHARRTIKQNNNDKVDRENAAKTSDDCENAGACICIRVCLCICACMWYKSNQRELDSTNAQSAHYSFDLMVEVSRLVLTQCLWHNIHILPMDICWFPLISLHFYIVSICDVYLSISKMRNALTNENGSNAQTLAQPKCLPNGETKNYGNAFALQFIKARARTRSLTYVHEYIFFWFDAVHRLYPDKMKRINSNLCKM